MPLRHVKRWGWLLVPVVIGVGLALALMWAQPGAGRGYTPF